MHLAIALAALLGMVLASPAWAEKDKDKGDNPGRGKGGPPGHSTGPAPGPAPQINVTISSRDRDAVYSYYRGQYVSGHCPPGLAKKNNGCLPPGQAKKLWALGQPLPAGIAFYPLPGTLLARLSPAPAGYQYVRVANDILMMAVGTRLIVGALADLANL